MNKRRNISILLSIAVVFCPIRCLMFGCSTTADSGRVQVNSTGCKCCRLEPDLLAKNRVPSNQAADYPDQDYPDQDCPDQDCPCRDCFCQGALLPGSMLDDFASADLFSFEVLEYSQSGSRASGVERTSGIRCTSFLHSVFFDAADMRALISCWNL